MTDEKNTTTGSPYAPWDLRRLPNFDFSEYLRKVEKPDGKGQTVEMSLEGTKRWFRLACPEGGLVLNPLPRRRLTHLCRRPQAVLPRLQTKRPSSLSLPLIPLPVPPP